MIVSLKPRLYSIHVPAPVSPVAVVLADVDILRAEMKMNEEPRRFADGARVVIGRRKIFDFEVGKRLAGEDVEKWQKDYLAQTQVHAKQHN